MKNRIKLPAVLLAALLAASSMALATQFTDPIESNVPRTVNVEKMSKRHGHDEGQPYPLPMPIEPTRTSFTASRAPGSEGNVGAAPSSVGAIGGGSAMMTPRQRADRQIRKVIRTLY